MNKLTIRLNTLADKLQPQIDHKFADRLANTPKRAREAASARLDGLHLERTQRALRKLAELHAAGTVPEILARVTTKTAAHELTRAEMKHDGGYYAAPIETGNPAHDTPEARLLWDLIQDNEAAGRKAAEELRRKLEDVRFKKIPGYFSTPDRVIERMVETIGLPDTPFKLLEPGAGSGAILDYIADRNPSAQLSAFEISPTLREILELKGYELEGGNFLEPAPLPIYDFVIMNPPFEREQDIVHVLQALRWLKEGGRLVSVLSGATPTRQSKRAEVFRNIVAAHGGWFEDLPEGSFKDCETGVSTVLVVIEK